VVCVWCVRCVCGVCVVCVCVCVCGVCGVCVWCVHVCVCLQMHDEYPGSAEPAAVATGLFVWNPLPCGQPRQATQQTCWDGVWHGRLTAGSVDSERLLLCEQLAAR
jgi:diadenosine tetraphosphatase ApaH/serine/threonine PP2A family protein phosphatase